MLAWTLIEFMLSIQKQVRIKRTIFVNMEQNAIQDYCCLTGAKPLVSRARPGSTRVHGAL